MGIFRWIKNMNKNMNKALFLDRDGIINYSILCHGISQPPKDISEVKIIPGIEIVLIYAIQQGFFPIVVTNQPDIARGNQKREIVEEINSYIKSRLPILEFFVCYHDNQDECSCRKPKPGLLLSASYKYNIQLSASYMIGDRRTDMLAGRSVGCETIYVNDEDIKSDIATFSVREIYDVIDIIGSKNV